MKNQQKAIHENEDIEAALGLGQVSRPHWMRFRVLIWFGIAAMAVTAAYMLWGFGTGNSVTSYKTEPVTRGDLTVVVTAIGTVQPTNQVDVSSELSGTIREVMVDYNDKVKIGQTLAELDTRKLSANVKSARSKIVAARARVKEAEATLVEKRLDFNRKKALVEREVYSVQDLEAAEAAYDRAIAALEIAKADVTTAVADLELYETDLANTCICSPINGVILNRNVEPGQTVASTLQAPVLFTIAEDLTKMEIQVDVDEADVGKVQEGHNATFTVDAYPDKEFSATIRELRFGSEIVLGVVTYKAVLTTDNSNLYLRPGMTATAEIIVREVKDAVTIPNAALRFSPSTNDTSTDNQSFLDKLLPGLPQMREPSAHSLTGANRIIWVLRDGEPFEVEVTIGATDGARTQVVDGEINPEEAVIVDTDTTSN